MVSVNLYLPLIDHLLYYRSPIAKCMFSKLLSAHFSCKMTGTWVVADSFSKKCLFV